VICPSTNVNLASKWSHSYGKRGDDLVISATGLLLLFPVMSVIGLAIAINSGLPVFFRQKRIGKDGREFQLLKFRTMTSAAPKTGPGLTFAGDSRVTGIGRWLRKNKLDELPQLINVLKGEMTLVGPRPDLEQFWLQASDEDRRVLQLKPGVTGVASLAYCDEERLLAQVPAEQLTSFYIQQVLPIKARLETEYAARATFRSDCELLLQTVFVSLLHRRQVQREVIDTNIKEQVSR
jgi:lipopolysaccharide/colanic/teichoic acid biosynthesis glycosyltransferase